MLIVMVSGEFPSDPNLNAKPIPTIGAGIIFGYQPDGVYILTANHVVRSSGAEARRLVVKFKSKPEMSFPAELLPERQNAAGMDFAVLSVIGLASAAIDKCALPMDLLEHPGALKRGDRVFPIGNPNGVEWGKPVIPDLISDANEREIVFQSNFLAPGDSGGALVSEQGRLIGMIRNDNPPFGQASNLNAVLTAISVFQRYPVSLTFLQRTAGPLHSAAAAGDTAALAALLSRPCPAIKSVDPEGSTPLHYAVASSQLAATTMLLDAGADVNAKAELGQTPIHLALKQPDSRIVQLLLDRHANLNVKDAAELTPLLSAIDQDAVDTVEMLLRRGADPNLQGNVSPLFESASRKSGGRLLPLLIAAGAHLNDQGGVWKPSQNPGYSPSSPFKVTALSEAVYSGIADNVRILLGAGAEVAWDEINGLQTGCGSIPTSAKPSPDARTFVSCNPLTAPTSLLLLQRSEPPMKSRAQLLDTAVAQRDPRWCDVVDILMKLGVDIRHPDFQNAVRRAAEWADVRSLGLLLERLAADKLGKVLLAQIRDRFELWSTYVLRSQRFWSRDLSAQVATLDLLAKAEGHRLDTVEPLICAAVREKASLPTVQYFFMLGHDRRRRCEYEPLLIVAVRDHQGVGVVDFLLKSGLDPNAKESIDYHGWTALHLAAHSPELTRLLLAAHARTGARDISGNTPLHLASQFNQEEVVQLLLQNGADPSARNSSGRTPKDEITNDQIKILLQNQSQTRK